MTHPLVRLLPVAVVTGLTGLCATAAFAAASNGDNGNGGQLPETRIEQAERDARTPSVFDDPLAGAVVNRTVTVLGRDFYRYFTMFWRQKDINPSVSIAIHERPSARFGSEIWVLYRQKRVFHAFLSPARAATRDIGEQAVEIVYRNIATNEVERALLRSPDLAPEEF